MTTPNTENERNDHNAIMELAIKDFDSTKTKFASFALRQLAYEDWIRGYKSAMQRVEREKDEEFIESIRKHQNKIRELRADKSTLETQLTTLRSELSTERRFRIEDAANAIDDYNAMHTNFTNQIKELRSENERLKQLLIDGIEETCIHGYTDSKFCDESNKCKWCIGLDKEGEGK